MLALLLALAGRAGVCETLKVGRNAIMLLITGPRAGRARRPWPLPPAAMPDGYDVRIAKIIAQELGRELEIVKTEWDGLAPALMSGKIDCIIAGMSPTEERKVTIDFTDPYYTTELCVVVRKDSAYAGAQSLADFAGAKITGQLNTFHYNVIDQIPDVSKQPAMETFPAMMVAVTAAPLMAISQTARARYPPSPPTPS